MKGMGTLRKSAVIAAMCLAVMCASGCNNEPEEDSDVEIVDGVLKRVRTSKSSFTIPKGVTEIGRYAFNSTWCPNLESVTIPNNVTIIGDYAFCGCKNLKNVNIADSVTSIGSAAFWLTGLTNVDMPNSVTSIGGAAFSECANLENVTIPNGVTSIEESAFKGCTSLANVSIPTSVTSIGKSAFYGCTSLTSVTIPGSVESIGGNVFSGVGVLTIKYSGTKSEWKKVASYITLPTGVTVICSDGNIVYETENSGGNNIGSGSSINPFVGTKWEWSAATFSFTSNICNYASVDFNYTCKYNNGKYEATIIRIYDNKIWGTFVIDSVNAEKGRFYLGEDINVGVTCYRK